jgi:GWxTD domain-containing protein
MKLRQLALLLYSLPFPLCLAQQLMTTMNSRQVSYDVVPCYSADTSATDVFVFYRINKSFFVYLRDNSVQSAERFSSRGELLVELTEVKTGKATRVIHPFSDIRTRMPQNDENLPDLEGLVSCSLPDGEYTGVFELRDQQSDRLFLDKKLRVVVARNNDVSGMNDWVLVTPSTNDSTFPFRAINRTEVLPFGESGGLLTQLRMATNEPIRLKWKLSTVGESGSDARSFVDSSIVFFDRRLVPETVGNAIRFHSLVPQTPWKSAFIPLPTLRLEAGRYLFSIETKLGKELVKREIPMTIVWLNKPFSLSRMDIAIDALRHIATEDEMSDMDSFITFDKEKVFKSFWKQRDPDTTTAFNERLAEYYRRVDESIRQFSSDNEPDGYKTDRGKIFILYGAPTKRDRLFSPNKPPTEVWLYQNAKKKFVFIDTSRKGFYILSQTEAL